MRALRVLGGKKKKEINNGREAAVTHCWCAASSDCARFARGETIGRLSDRSEPNPLNHILKREKCPKKILIRSFAAFLSGCTLIRNLF